MIANRIADAFAKRGITNGAAQARILGLSTTHWRRYVRDDKDPRESTLHAWVNRAADKGWCLRVCVDAFGCSVAADTIPIDEPHKRAEAK